MFKALPRFQHWLKYECKTDFIAPLLCAGLASLVLSLPALTFSTTIATAFLGSATIILAIVVVLIFIEVLT